MISKTSDNPTGAPTAKSVPLFLNNNSNYDVGDHVVIIAGKKLVVAEYKERINSDNGLVEGNFSVIAAYRAASSLIDFGNGIDDILNVGSNEDGTEIETWRKAFGFADGEALFERYDPKSGVFRAFHSNKAGTVSRGIGFSEQRRQNGERTPQMDAGQNEDNTSEVNLPRRHRDFERSCCIRKCSGIHEQPRLPQTG